MSRKPKKPPNRRTPVAGGTVDPARGAVLGISILLVLAVLLVFGRTISFGFVDFDDPGNVSENPFVKKGLAWESIVWAFTHRQIGDWIPLTTLSHLGAVQLFGLWAGGHHLVNVLIHAATSLLLFLVLRDMTGSLWRCAFVAAVFALHPLRAESVAWVTERKDLLSGLFFMLTLGAHARWARGAGSRIWAPVFLALGLLCKTMLVTTPLVLLLLDRWPLRRAERIGTATRVIEKAPLFVLCLAAAIGQVLAAREGIGSIESYPLGRRAANAVVSCATYVVQMVWPANLAGFYPYPRQGVDPLAFAGSAVLLAALSAAAWRWRRQAPWFAVGWLWYLAMLLPVLGLVQAGEAARADRYTYLPQIGLYLMVAWGAGAWCAERPERRVAAWSAALPALLVLAVLAFRQTGFWRDSAALWHRALACTVDNDTAHYNLATGLLRAGRTDDAMAHYRRTLEANPGYADAHINLGRIFMDRGMPLEAMTHYRKAIEVKPRYAEAHYNLAVVLARQGELDEAVARYRKAIEINPESIDARNNLGSVLLRSGRVDDAVVEFEEVLRSRPGHAGAHHNLATALAGKGRVADAVAHFQAALEIDPAHAKARNSLAWILATSAEPGLRNGPRAVELARRAVELTGGKNPAMLRTLAAASAEAGGFEEAVQTALRAIDLATAEGQPDLARALRGEVLLYQSGKPVR